MRIRFWCSQKDFYHNGSHIKSSYRILKYHPLMCLFLVECKKFKRTKQQKSIALKLSQSDRRLVANWSKVLEESYQNTQRS